MTIKEEHLGRLLSTAHSILMQLSSAPVIGLALICFGLYFWVNNWMRMINYKKLLK